MPRRACVRLQRVTESRNPQPRPVSQRISRSGPFPSPRKGRLSRNSSWKQRVPELRPHPLAVLELRAWARAYLWSVGEFGLHEAVDVLQRDAVYEGLIIKSGQDAVQAILRDAFHRFRECAV